MKSSLRPGTSISHYRVIGPLGAGGMGEVYEAHDATLERSVALKILPPELTTNQDRLRRFIQEAKSASSLSHPHIVTIHEIGTARVSSPGGVGAPLEADSDVHFIAMELIHGDTLRQKIHEDGADLRTLLGYLAQAAEGLAKAHAAGIVHRDLKPENIMVTHDGYAKVLDFGLAKLNERKPIEDEATNVLTAMNDKTREGTILGTIGYMSPEQVQGRVLDHRSDIFSFGCLLYEAATRQKPFAADSDIDAMHRILHDRPLPIEQLNPQAPAELRRIIRRCLAKEPEKRYQSMKDLALELDELVTEYDELSGVSSPVSGISVSTTGLAPPPAKSTRHSGVSIWIPLAAFAIAALAILSPRWTHRGAGPKSSFQSMKIQRLAGNGRVAAAAISPDGKYIANAIEDGGQNSLWVRQVATASDVQIVPPSALQYRGVSFTRDGNYVYFVRTEAVGSPYSVLYQVAALGGAPRKLVFDVDTPVAQSPQGDALAFLRGAPQVSKSVLIVAHADGTGERQLASRQNPKFLPLIAPAWSPDGKWIAVIEGSTEGGIHNRLIAVSARDGTERAIGSKSWLSLQGVDWLADGSGLLITGAESQANLLSQVWFVSYPGGEARRITNDLNNYGGVSVTADSKTLATVQFTTTSNLSLWDPSRTEPPRPLTSGRDERVNSVAGLASGQIVYSLRRGNTEDLWISEADGSNSKQLTTSTTLNFNPAVSPGAKFVLFTSLRNGGVLHIWRIGLDGENLKQLTTGVGEDGAALSPDGTWFMFTSSDADAALWRSPSEGGTSARIAERVNGFGAISPDGSMIVYSCWQEDAGRVHNSLVVLPTNATTPLHTFELPEAGRVRWTPDGAGLTYALTREGVSNLWMQPLEGGAPRQLTRFKNGRIFSYGWTADGKQLLLATGDVLRDVVLISDFR